MWVGYDNWNWEFWCQDGLLCCGVGWFCCIGFVLCFIYCLIGILIMSYNVFVKDMLFVLKEFVGIDVVVQLLGFEDVGYDMVQVVFDEFVKFCGEVLVLLNVEGDCNLSSWKDGVVIVMLGFGEVFCQFVEGGWQGLQYLVEYDGQGLLKLIVMLCIEMLNVLNLLFVLCLLFIDGVIEVLLMVGIDEQKQCYVLKLILGEWIGMMNLIELQVGFDFVLVCLCVELQGDGIYKVFGIKIFIMWGEYDMVDNIVYLVFVCMLNVLEGVKGILLFIVLKFMVNDDGLFGVCNDVYCVLIEYKFGIKVSLMVVLQYGDYGGVIGYLVGEENCGFEYMFIMMNVVCFGVGMQGIGVVDCVYQKVVEFVKECVQSCLVDGLVRQLVMIIYYLDVCWMLGMMCVLIEGVWVLVYVVVVYSDIVYCYLDEVMCVCYQVIYEYLVLVVKGWSMEMVNDVVSLGVQVYGGMGFIEEMGVVQYYCDVWILVIYEGMMVIQVNDLVGCKMLCDGGVVVKVLFVEIGDMVMVFGKLDGVVVVLMKVQLEKGVCLLVVVVDYVFVNVKQDLNVVFVGSVLYLKLVGVVLCGWQMVCVLVVVYVNCVSDLVFFDVKIVIV